MILHKNTTSDGNLSNQFRKTSPTNLTYIQGSSKAQMYILTPNFLIYYVEIV